MEENNILICLLTPPIRTLMVLESWRKMRTQKRAMPVHSIPAFMANRQSSDHSPSTTRPLLSRWSDPPWNKQLRVIIKININLSGTADRGEQTSRYVCWLHPSELWWVLRKMRIQHLSLDGEWTEWQKDNSDHCLSWRKQWVDPESN